MPSDRTTQADGSLKTYRAPAPGQVWEHVGFDGVPATGLRIRILRHDHDRLGRRYGWVCDYPDAPQAGERRYSGGPWRGYALVKEAV